MTCCSNCFIFGQRKLLGGSWVLLTGPRSFSFLWTVSFSHTSLGTLSLTDKGVSGSLGLSGPQPKWDRKKSLLQNQRCAGGWGWEKKLEGEPGETALQHSAYSQRITLLLQYLPEIPQVWPSFRVLLPTRGVGFTTVLRGRMHRGSVSPRKNQATDQLPGLWSMVICLLVSPRL